MVKCIHWISITVSQVHSDSHIRKPTKILSTGYYKRFNVRHSLSFAFSTLTFIIAKLWVDFLNVRTVLMGRDKSRINLHFCVFRDEPAWKAWGCGSCLISLPLLTDTEPDWVLLGPSASFCDGIFVPADCTIHVPTAHPRILYIHIQYSLTPRNTCTVPVMTMQWCCAAAEWRRLGHVIRSDEGVTGPSHSWHSWQCLTRHRVTWPPTLIVTQLSHFTLGKIADRGYSQ